MTEVAQQIERPSSQNHIVVWTAGQLGQVALTKGRLAGFVFTLYEE